MLKKSLLVLLLSSISIGAYAYELPKLGGDKAAASGNIEADVAEFLNKSNELSEIANKALGAINSAFRTEEEVAASKAALEAAAKITNPGEKAAAMAKVQASEQATFDKNVQDKATQEKMKNLSDDKKKLLTKATLNLGLSFLKIPSLLDQGKKVISGASLTNVMKVMPVKDALPSLQKYVTGTAASLAGFIKVAKGADIQISETTSNSSNQNPEKLDY